MWVFLMIFYAFIVQFLSMNFVDGNFVSSRQKVGHVWVSLRSMFHETFNVTGVQVSVLEFVSSSSCHPVQSWETRSLLSWKAMPLAQAPWLARILPPAYQNLHAMEKQGDSCLPRGTEHSALATTAKIILKKQNIILSSNSPEAGSCRG